MLSLYYVQPVSRPKLIGAELTFFGALLSGLDITFPGGERYNNAAASSPTTQCWIAAAVGVGRLAGVCVSMRARS